jgi:hypothetical protein
VRVPPKTATRSRIPIKPCPGSGEEHGLHSTPVRDPAITWTVLIVGAPFLRYLLGMTLVGTGGSVLAVAIMHASFASGALSAVHGWWPSYAAMLVLVALTAAARRRGQARLDDRGYASAGSVSTFTR